MNKTRKITLPLAAILLTSTAVMAAGCTVDTSGSRGDPDYVPQMSFTKEELEGTQIEFWTGFGQDIQKVVADIISKFQTETGIIVTHKPQGGYENLSNSISLASGTKKYPNIAVGYGDHFANYADANIIMHLDGYIEADKNRTAMVDEVKKIDYEDFYKAYTAENENIVFDDETDKGYILGVPFNKSSEVGTYNETLFNLVKAYDSSIRLPDEYDEENGVYGWTWDEVETEGLKIRQVLHDQDFYGKNIFTLDGEFKVYDNPVKALEDGAKQYLDLTAVTEENFKVLSYNSTDNWFITGVRQWGGKYTEYDKEVEEGYVAFNSQNTKDFLTRMAELFNKGLLGIPSTWGEQLYCSNPFKLNQSAINISSTAGVKNSIAEGSGKSELSIKACPVPYKDKDNAYVISQGTNLALFDKGNDKQRFASWLFLIYLSQVKDADFCIRTGYFPTGEAVRTSDEYQEYINSTKEKSTERLEKDAAWVNSDIYDAPQTPYKKFVDPAFVGSSYIRTVVNNVMKQLFYGDNKDVTHILNNVLRTLNDYIKD